MTHTNPIAYSILHAKRRTIGIYVRRNGSVEVIAPKHASRTHIQTLVEKRAEWIEAQRTRLRHLPTLHHTTPYHEGKEIRVLGVPHRITVERSLMNQVHPQEPFLRVYVTRLDPIKTDQLIRRWLEKEATKILTQRLALCLPHAEKHGIFYHAPLTFRWMKARWGSCSHDHRITLNFDLLAAPLPCIDYVIFHELCHLRELNHSPAFYTLLSHLMPGWQRWRKILNGQSENLV